MIKNNKGFITADYLFALVMVLGFTVIMFSFAIALIGAEVTQYMTFSAARAYLPAHKTYADQEALGIQKFDSLRNKRIIKTLFNDNWFAQPGVELGNHKDKTIYTFEAGTDKDAFSFYGASTGFTAKILNFSIPLLGSTSKEGEEDNSQFTTTIGSFLGKETSQLDCMGHMQSRWRTIRHLNSGGIDYGGNNSDGGYFEMADNGC